MNKKVMDVVMVVFIASILLFFMGYRSLKDRLHSIEKNEVLILSNPPSLEYLGLNLKENHIIKMNKFVRVVEDKAFRDIPQFDIDHNMNLEDVAKEFGTSVDNFQSLNTVWDSLIESNVVIDNLNYKEYNPNLLNEVYYYYSRTLCNPNNEPCRKFLKEVAPNSGILIFIKIKVYERAYKEGVEDIYLDSRIEYLNSMRFDPVRREVSRIATIMNPSYFMRSREYNKLNEDAFTYLQRDKFTTITEEYYPLLEEFLREIDRLKYNPKYSPGMIRLLKDQDPKFILPIDNDPKKLNMFIEKYRK